MRFQVPQYIEVEDKIIGPLTLKQFIYLAGGAAGAFVAWRFLPQLVAFLVIPAIGALAAALAFFKVNNKPFVNTLEAAFKYTFGSKLYIWKKVPKVITAKEEEEGTYASLYVPKLSDSKLKDLNWSLDVKKAPGGSTEATTDINSKTSERY